MKEEEVAVEIHKVFLKVITFIKINSSLSQSRKTTQKENLLTNEKCPGFISSPFCVEDYTERLHTLNFTWYLYYLITKGITGLLKA